MSPKPSSTEPLREAFVTPLAEDQLTAVEDIVEMSRQFSGYLATSIRIMARKPEMLRAFVGLRDAVMRSDGEVPRDLKWLAAHAVSQSAGCRYCQAHTAANGNKAGLAVAKIEALPQFETLDIFSPAERAIIAFGLAAGQVPNEVEDAHFQALREHFSEDGIVELVGVISLFGWLNRWNDTFASALEEKPRAFAEQHLSRRGWSVGRHAGV